MKNLTNKNLQRMRDLMGNKKPINESKLISSVELVKKSSEGKFYGIVRENKKYFIKESNDGSNFDFIGGVANKMKNQFESYEQAVRRLNLMLEDTDVLTPDIIEEKKFVIKTKKKKTAEPKSDDTTESGGDFNFGGEETEEEPKGGGEDFDFGGEETEEESKEGGEDFDFGDEEDAEEEPKEGGEDFDFGDEDSKEGEGDFDSEDEDYDLEDEGEDSIKSIQKMTGKLGQKLRDTEDLSSDTMKWVAKSVLSALDLEGMDSDDKKDLIRTIKKKKDEGTDEEFDFMDDKMESPIITYMSDDTVSWDELSDEEKSNIINKHIGKESDDYDMDYMEGEDDMYGPGDGEIESGEEILSDDEDENCSYCSDRDMPYYEDETEMSQYPSMEEDFMSKFAKNVKRAQALRGKKIDEYEIENHLNKIKNKLGGSVNIDGDKVVGEFGYVEVTPHGYVLHKEGERFGKNFQFHELGKLHDYIRKDYMDDPYMMPQTAPARPQIKPETPVKPGKPETDKPSPSKKPFTPPPYFDPNKPETLPGPKAWEKDGYYDEYGDEYGDEYYGPTEGMDYMEDDYYGSFDKKNWYNVNDTISKIGPSYEYEEFEYPDYESFRASEFGKDPKNRWFQGHEGKSYFDRYASEYGPMKIRKPRPEINYDEFSEYFDAVKKSGDVDYMEDDDMEMCQICQGKGHERSIGFKSQYNPCVTCGGTGKVSRAEIQGEVDEPYTENPFGYHSDDTMPSNLGFKYQYKERFNFPFKFEENTKSRKTLKEDHLNTKMASYEQEMAYEDVESMSRKHGMDVKFCHKDRSKDPEEQTVYLDLMKNGKSVATIRINSVGDIEMGHMKDKVFKGEPVDSHSDFDEVLDEKNIKTPMNPAPARPQIKPETPTKPAPTKPGTDKPSPSKKPFTPPPYFDPNKPETLPGPKAWEKVSYMDETKPNGKNNQQSKPNAKTHPFKKPQGLEPYEGPKMREPKKW